MSFQSTKKPHFRCIREKPTPVREWGVGLKFTEAFLPSLSSLGVLGVLGEPVRSWGFPP